LQEKTHFISHTPVKISSTMIRNLINDGQDISELVPESVQQIINDERLYH
jgi:nicotinic acid mononucleotide adenylyltransferase